MAALPTSDFNNNMPGNYTLDVDELESALSVLDPSGYEEWIACGIALSALGDEGFTLWDGWSQGAHNYSAKDCLKHWRSFRPDRTSYRAIFAKARARGWRPVKPAKPFKPLPKPTISLWSRAQPIDWKGCYSVTAYLNQRCLGAIAEDPPENVRWLPKLDYFHEGKRIGSWPAMICLVEDASSRPCALHITYLTEQGEKAPVPSPRKVRGSLPPGAAIRLYPHLDRLAVCEGVETALALRLGMGLWCNVWSLINAGNLSRFEPPKGIKHLDIYADRDKSSTGLRAAQALAERHINARVFLPSKQQCRGVFQLRGSTDKSVDWLDVLACGGLL